MKTIKFIFSLLVSLMLVVPALAAPTDGYVYSKDVSAILGEEFDLPIAIKNTEFKVKSFQFNITLPDGLSFASNSEGYKATLESDYSNWVVNHATEEGAPSNTALVLVSCQKDRTTCIDKGDHVVLYLGIKVDKDADLTNSKITLSKETVTLEDGTETTPLTSGETITSTVSEGTYADGYSLEIVPFKIASMSMANLDVNFKSAENLASFSFDIQLPSSIAFSNPSINADCLNNAGFAGFFTVTSASATISGNSAMSSMVYINSGEAKLLTLPILCGAIEDGIYTLKIENISFTDVSGNVTKVAPYTADIYVGATTPVATPDANGAVAFHGNYADETAQALMTEALKSDDITTIDLSEVTAATEIVPQNKNAIIRCTKDLGLTQDNVVIGDECANLVLTDGYAFRNTEAFTATTASYSRTMADHSWGTLCLPFAASSTNANVYTLNSVTTGTDGEMKFTQTASAAVEANTPCVIKKDADEITFTATSVEVPVTPADSKVATSVAGWTLLGTTTDLNVADLSKAYFINGDHFWKAGTSLHVAPFRAYFEGASSAAKFRITEETNGIETIENEAEAGVIYDLQGRAVKAAQAGQIYVQGAKKFVVK